MAKYVLIKFLFLSVLITKVHAQFLGFGGDSEELNTKIVSVIEKLKAFDLNPGPGSEELFNQLVKESETALDEEKLYCAGEATDSNGKFLASEKRLVCSRSLKKKYVEVIQLVFNHKIQYLEKINLIQLKRLKETKDKMIQEVDSRF